MNIKYFKNEWRVIRADGVRAIRRAEKSEMVEATKEEYDEYSHNRWVEWKKIIKEDNIKTEVRFKNEWFRE